MAKSSVSELSPHRRHMAGHDSAASLEPLPPRKEEFLASTFLPKCSPLTCLTSAVAITIHHLASSLPVNALTGDNTHVTSVAQLARIRGCCTHDYRFGRDFEAVNIKASKRVHTHSRLIVGKYSVVQIHVVACEGVMTNERNCRRNKLQSQSYMSRLCIPPAA